MNANETFAINTQSTMHLLDYARTVKVKTFILASTGGVYGSGNNSFIEDSQIDLKSPMGFYPTTKICSEKVAETYNKIMNIIIIRPFFVYGPAQKKYNVDSPINQISKR